MKEKTELKPSSYWINYKKRECGRLIILNGTSSSGKGSIVKELQNTLKPPFLHFSIDTFFCMLPSTTLTSPSFSHEIIPILKGFYESVSAFLKEGNNVIIDTVLQDGIYDLRLLLSSLKDFEALFVGIKCNLEELNRREKERGDRHIGLAQYQYPRVHIHEKYDFEIDTTSQSPEECARQIKTAFENQKKQSVLKELFNLYHDSHHTSSY